MKIEPHEITVREVVDALLKTPKPKETKEEIKDDGGNTIR